jgi:hypothetical protein
MSWKTAAANTIRFLQTVMFFKGFHAVQAQRVAAKFWSKGSMSSKHVALAIQNRVSELWSVDIHPNAVLGGGMLMVRRFPPGNLSSRLLLGPRHGHRDRRDRRYRQRLHHPALRHARRHGQGTRRPASKGKGDGAAV